MSLLAMQRVSEYCLWLIYVSTMFDRQTTNTTARPNSLLDMQLWSTLRSEAIDKSV
jgi:hypothetical protein